MSDLIRIDDETFELEVLGSKKRFLLDVTAKWCGPCRAMLPSIHAIAAENEATLKVGTLDIDEAIMTGRALRVRGAPTLILFEDGKEIARHLGMASPSVLRAFVTQ